MHDEPPNEEARANRRRQEDTRAKGGFVVDLIVTLGQTDGDVQRSVSEHAATEGRVNVAGIIDAAHVVSRDFELVLLGPDENRIPRAAHDVAFYGGTVDARDGRRRRTTEREQENQRRTGTS